MLDLKISYNEPYRHNDRLEVHTLDPKTVRIFHHIKKYEDFYSIVLSSEVSSKYYYMLFDEIRSNLVSDTQQRLTDERINHYFHSYTANAILGLIIEWYRRGFLETVEEMNIQLVNIVQYKL